MPGDQGLRTQWAASCSFFPSCRPLNSLGHVLHNIKSRKGSFQQPTQAGNRLVRGWGRSRPERPSTSLGFTDKSAYREAARSWDMNLSQAFSPLEANLVCQLAGGRAQTGVKGEKAVVVAAAGAQEVA